MRLLALVDSPDHVCCRYRIRAFEPALHLANCTLVCQAMERGLFPRLRQLRSAAAYDAVILQRKLLPAWQLALLRKHARHLAFDFDDAVMLRDSYDARGVESPRRAARFRRVVRTADVVIAGNDFLADAALRAGTPAERVRTIPTCVDPSLYPTKAPGPDPGRPLELVWIGSSSTLKGIEARRGLWEKLGRAFPGLRLRVICDRFPDFEHIEVIPTPWSESTEAEDLARGDVGIGMIPDDDWSRGKCGLKILQYQAAGLPVVANPVGSHNEMVEPGVTGWLAHSDEEWVDAVRKLADASTRARMGAEARKRLESNYSVAAWGATFAASTTGKDRPLTIPRESGPAKSACPDYAPNFSRRRSRATGDPRLAAVPQHVSRHGRPGSE